MSTGSKVADERIARIAAAAPEFTDEQFALIKRLMKPEPNTKAVTALTPGSRTSSATRRAA